MNAQNVYSVYDRKAQYFLPPFVLRSDADATRTFVEAVTTSDTPLAQYPADFDLVCVGTFDQESGELLPVQPTRLIINGLVCLEAAQRERLRYKTILDNTPPETDAA